MKYSDITICSWDLEYIQELARELNINIWEAEILEGTQVANCIISYLQYEWVQALDILWDSKVRLFKSMYTNCLDSWFSVDIEDFPANERTTIESLISLF